MGLECGTRHHPYATDHFLQAFEAFMSNEQSVDKDRRNAIVATSVVGGVGALCTAWPFVNTFAPSEKAKAAGAPVEVDISQLKDGEMILREWRGQPVWILK